MNKVYSRINWENSPSEETPLNESNLNKMDSALNEIDNRIVSMDTSKANVSDLYNYVQSWSMDEQTGVITITKGTGEKIIFDLNVEKIPVDFSLSNDGILTMTTSDGSTFTANIGAMIPVLTFADSDEITVAVSGSGVNKTYSFSIKNGSVTENKLQPNFLADIKVEVAKAESSSSSASDYASASSNYADISKSYAIGTDGQVRDNDGTDNAKYYMEQAKLSYTDVSDKTVTFESEDIADPTEYTDLPSVITSGEKTSSLMKKFSNFARNIRYIKKLLGNTDLSAFSNGTITDASESLHNNQRRDRRNITSNLGNLPTAVAEQNLGKYGYSIGDYFTGASGYTYIIADYNTFKGTLTPYCITTNHIGLIVDTHSTSQWHTGDASSVGYNGSTLHTFLKGTVMDNIKSDFKKLFGGSTGLEHLLRHSKLLTTALSKWAWQSDQYISALGEAQMYGFTVWSANGYQTGEAAKKLQLFDAYKWTDIFGGEYPWLRNLMSASDACNAGNNGRPNYYPVPEAYFVVGLINFY